MGLGGIVGSFIGGGNPLMSLGVSALTGGLGGLVIDLFKQVLSQMIQNTIDQSKLPEPLKDMLKDVVVDNLGEGLPGNPGTNEGIAEYLSGVTGADLNESQAYVDETSQMVDMFLETGQSGAEETSRKGKGSWMMQMAVALGKMLDDKFEEVNDAIAHVNDVKSGAGDMVSSGHKLSGAGKRAEREGPGAVAEMQGRMQEMGFLLNAVSSAIKTAGQGAATLAGKN